MIDWGVAWGERRKAAAASAPEVGNGFAGNGSGYNIDEIEQIVRAGAPEGANRSDKFHAVVGHYVGCDWDIERIVEHLQQFPDGIGARYIAENRLAKEVERSAGKYGATKAADPPPEDDPELRDERKPQDEPDPELEDDLDEESDDEEPKEVGMTSAELNAATYALPSYVVPGFIVEGLTLLAGKPKTGKSWLMMHAAIAVARGAFTLGDVYCAKGDVLYCALEDNKRRLQRRQKKLLDGQPAPKNLRFLSAGEMPLLSQGGMELLERWIEQERSPKLIVIDVLAKVRDRRQKDQGLYDADYAAMQGLKALADAHGIAVVVVHHLRKMDAEDPLDQISGTTGLAGAADTVLVLNRTSAGVVLHGRGRDIEDIEKAVQFDPGACTWAILGNASSVQYSSERAAVLAALQEATEPMSPADLAAVTGMKIGNVRKLLAKLVRDGVAERVGRGRYASTPKSEA